MSALTRVRCFCLTIFFFATLFFSEIPRATGSFLIVDDFEDGDISDGDPLSWSELGPAGADNVIEARDGGLFVQLTNLNSSLLGYRAKAEPNPFVEGDTVSVQARVRLLSGFIAIQTNEFGIVAGINDSGTITVGGGVAVGLTPFEPLNEDLLMQLDAFEDVSEFRVWRPGEDKPDVPIYTSGGSRRPRGVDPSFAVVVGARQGETASGIFRYVAMADEVIPDAIPEPSTYILALGCLCFAGGRRL